MGLYVNDVLVSQWTGTRTGRIKTHHVVRPVELRRGDQLRIDFYTQGKARCRIDYLSITRP